MIPSVKLSDLNTSEGAARLDALMESAASMTHAQALTVLEAKIRLFEKRYETSSNALVAEIAAGKRAETLEICSWLMLLKRRKRLLAQA